MDQRNINHQWLRIFLLLASCLLLSSCAGSSENASGSGKTYPVSEDLQQFYNDLGGEEVLGPAISKLNESPSAQCQFTVNAQLCINPVLVGEERFSLSPLGSTLKLNEDTPAVDSTSSLVINGYAVYEEFIPLYDQLGETQYAGNPISPVHLNYARERIEQFFENVGFYRNFSDPRGTVKLLAYGAAGCSKACGYHPASEASLTDAPQPLADQSLLDDLDGVTDVKAFGKALTQPYLAADGNQEQVFEGAVLYRDISNGVIRFRPLSTLLGMLSTEPGEKMYESGNGMVFYVVKDNLGYHVPELFDQFINEHGGPSLSGDPIAEVIEYQPGVYRQCFTNYCLDYTPKARKEMQVVMASLGSQYLQLPQITLTVPPSEVIETEAAVQTLSLRLIEQYNPLPLSAAQQIMVVVTSAADQIPVPDLHADLVVNLPNGSTYEAEFPPTLADGSSVVTLPVMKKIPNGSILTYQVCVTGPAGEVVCQNSSYLMWTAP